MTKYDQQLQQPIATIRLCVDFPDAEGIWVQIKPLYAGDSISDSLESLSKRMIDSLSMSAGSLYASRGYEWGPT